MVDQVTMDSLMKSASGTKSYQQMTFLLWLRATETHSATEEPMTMMTGYLTGGKMRTMSMTRALTPTRTDSPMKMNLKQGQTRKMRTRTAMVSMMALNLMRVQIQQTLTALLGYLSLLPTITSRESRPQQVTKASMII